MNIYSDDKIARAVEEVPGKSTKKLKVLLERARKQGLSTLEAAIEAEIALRGSFIMDDDIAALNHKWTQDTQDLDLQAAMITAFKTVKLNKDERYLVMLIAQHPGITHDELRKSRGKGDVGLILGHIIYERLGFFRRFLGNTKNDSDLIFERTYIDGRVTYKLKKDAEEALKDQLSDD